MKVLFVDDEPRVLEALERSLRIGGVSWETRFVTSGVAALAALDQGQFDVIVSDMRMPGMDGAALLPPLRRAIRRWYASCSPAKQRRHPRCAWCGLPTSSSPSPAMRRSCVRSWSGPARCTAR